MSVGSLRIPTAVAAAALDERPLLLLLHGYGSHEGDLPGITAALPQRFQWASLRAPLALATGGFAWVPIVRPGRPEPAAVRAAASAVLAWLDDHVDPAVPVVPVGFSQGGLVASQLLRTRHERFAAAAVLSGFVLEGTEPGDAALAAARVPVFAGRGDADAVITPEAFARSDAWLPAHADLTARVYAGLGHGIAPDELRDLSAWLEAAVPAAGTAAGADAAPDAAPPETSAPDARES